MFTQLFPSIYPYGGSTIRATPLFDDIGKVISEHYQNTTNATDFSDDPYSGYFGPPFNYREALDQDLHGFSSWQDYFGPHEQAMDNFTSISRFDLDDPYSLSGNISNYGDLTKITPQVFQPDDIILVQDGGCGSTCTIFTELMRSQGKVKQIVFGGRRQSGPMQGVGGIKGSEVWTYDDLFNSYQSAYDLAEPAKQLIFQENYGSLNTSFAQARNRSITDGAPKPTPGRFNLRNNIRYGDKTVTPLQFVYEAADCRLFYTIESTRSHEAAWNAAYAATWGDGHCVAGSTGHPSRIADSNVSHLPPDEARNFFGAKRLNSWPSNLK